MLLHYLSIQSLIHWTKYLIKKYFRNLIYLLKFTYLNFLKLHVFSTSTLYNIFPFYIIYLGMQLLELKLKAYIFFLVIYKYQHYIYIILKCIYCIFSLFSHYRRKYVSFQRIKSRKTNNSYIQRREFSWIYPACRYSNSSKLPKATG